MLTAYLKSRIRFIYLIILILLIFSSSNLLFDMPPISVIYPLSLCFVIILIAGVIDYFKTRETHHQIQLNTFPETHSIIEQDYQSVIEKLKEEELVTSESAAAKYSNMIDYYTTWAHQIKTPIASMRLNLQSEDSETARRLSTDLSRIESYVEMVLAFLRLDSNNTDLLIHDCRLDDIIRASVRKYAREFILKKLTVDFEPTESTVLTDEKWLAFVLDQIISNAVKYTLNGGIHIYMHEPGILCIKDTGIGIRSEDLPRIFENGYTGFNGREDKRATGIGLYLCKRVCDNLQHRIWAESTLGVGTLIYLDLNRTAVGIE